MVVCHSFPPAILFLCLHKDNILHFIFQDKPPALCHQDSYLLSLFLRVCLESLLETKDRLRNFLFLSTENEIIMHWDSQSTTPPRSTIYGKQRPFRNVERNPLIKPTVLRFMSQLLANKTK